MTVLDPPSGYQSWECRSQLGSEPCTQPPDEASGPGEQTSWLCRSQPLAHRRRHIVAVTRL